MRVKIPHTVFKDAVSKAFSTVDPADKRLLMTAILFEAQGDRLRLLGSDLSLGAVVEIPCIADPGRVLVPSKKIVQIAKTMPEGDVLLIAQNNELHIFGRYEEDADGKPSSKAHWAVHVHDPRLYPDFPKFESDKAVLVERETFLKALQRVLVAIPTKPDPKYLHLQGVYLDGSCMYTTDYHMSIREVCSTGVEGLFIPGEAANLLVSLLKKSSEQYFKMFRRGDTYVLFSIGAETYHAALRDTKFPDVERLSFVPSGRYTRLVLVNRKELLAAIDRADVTANQKSFMLTLQYEDGKMALSTRDAVDDRFVEVIDGVEMKEGTDERFERNVKLDSFRDLVAICRSDRVALKTGTSNAVEDSRIRIEDNGLVAVLLPIRVEKVQTVQPTVVAQTQAEASRPHDGPIPF